jgi:hypothetical protein
MAKRERRGTSSSKSKVPLTENAPGVQPAESGQPEQDHRKKPSTHALSPPRTPSVQSDSAVAPAQRLGIGRRTRTPLPTTSGQPDPAGARTQRIGTGRQTPAAQTASIGSHRANAPPQELGKGRRLRTPPPRPIRGELEEINLGGGRQQQGRQVRRREGTQNRAPREGRRAKLEAKAAQFRDIQDFLHNPNLFDLRGSQLDTSSTAEEIEARKGEVRYQLQVMRSIVAVLTEELNELDQARPQAGADQTTPSHS